jgi:diguanylate cyclase (GGDEF)-like protein/PAS domain S-box-containing protein
MGIYTITARSKQPMAKLFAVFCLLASVYTFGSALELSSGSLAEIKLWIKVQYLGMPFLPPLNLLLILYFLGMAPYVKRYLRWILFIMPTITVALVMTNDLHHFYYRAIELRPGIDMLKVDLNVGPWYIIQGAFTFGCMVGGAFLLLLRWNSMKSSYRLPFFTMLTGLLLPIAGDFAYLSNKTPDGMDPIPVLMAVTSGLYMWALGSKGLFNVAPIAREILFESMGDGVIVLDVEDRLVDYNPAAAAVLPELSSAVIGRRLERLWSLHTDEPFIGAEEKRSEHGTSETSDLVGSQELLWRVRGQAYYYHMRSSIVRKKNGQRSGKLIVMIDVTQRVRLQQQLKELAYHDGLTGIYNRVHFLHLSEALLVDSLAEGKPISFVLFDIDHFKRVNDSFGHDVGDQALLHVVEICREELRSEDVFARYGGEEFVVAMPGLGLAEATAAAHRLRSAIAAKPMSSPQQPLAITASFGVAVSGAKPPGSAESAAGELQRLLKAADGALYAAKYEGRDTVRAAEGEEPA